METAAMAPSGDYLLGSGLSEQERLKGMAEGLKEWARWLLVQAGMTPGWRVIDLGCGPRGILDLLAEYVRTDGAVVGLDADEDMVAQARAFVAERALPNTHIMQADARRTG